MSEFTPINTQEELDAVIGERIKRAQENAAKKYEGFISPDEYTQRTSELQGKYDSLTKELETANGKVADFEKSIAEKDNEIKGYKTASLKTRIAHEVGLDFGAVEFLKGEDEESITKSAEALKGLMGSQGAPLASTEGNGTGGEDAALKKLASKLRNQED